MLIFALVTAAAAPASLDSATLPLPPELRDSASIVSMDKAGIHTLRKGTGKMVCIADAPGDDVFDARCYHRDFIPYFYRLQQLSAEGVPEEQMDARIEKELESGTLHMRMQPSAGYRMYGPITALTNGGTGWTAKMTRWQSIHIPRATAEDMGLVTDNKPLMPYVMASGSLWAHVMINSPAD